MCADAPNTEGINAAAKANADIARESLAWYKQQYADTAPQRQQASDLALEQAGIQNDLAKQQLENSQKSQQRYDSTFAPIEQKIASDAMGYDTPARREAAARAAVADTQMAADAGMAATRRELERRGVNPASGKALALRGSQDIALAKAKAGAANQARQNVETIGAARLQDAAGVGRGVFTNNTTQAQIGLSAGNSAVNNGQVPVNVAAQGAATMGQGFQTAMQGNSSAGNLYGQAASLQGNNDGLWSTLGQVGGTLLAKAPMFASDKNEKTGKKKMRGEVALQAARRMPVSKWKYKPGGKYDDGGQEHVGPMAQDVQAAAGDDVAPGGKMIDPISMQGITLAAVQQLDRKVQLLEKHIAKA